MDNNDGKYDGLRRRVPTRRNPTDGGARSPVSTEASSNVLLEGGRGQSGSRSSSPNDRPRQGDEFSFLLSTLQSASPEQRRLLCELCRLAKGTEKPVYHTALASRPLRPNLVWSCDTKGPLRVTKRNNRFLLGVKDHASPWRLYAPIRNLTAEEIIRGLKYILQSGLQPKKLRFDNHKSFLSKKVDDFLSARGIESRFSTPREPTGNSAVERCWQQFSRVAKPLSSRDWDIINLDAAYYEDRQSAKTFADFSASQLVFGETAILYVECNNASFLTYSRWQFITSIPNAQPIKSINLENRKVTLYTKRQKADCKDNL